jgi:hypothetical protein
MSKPLEEYYRNLQPLDIPDIQSRVADLKQYLDFFESVVDERSSDEAIKLIYEELYFSKPAKQKRQIAALWEFLGIAPLDLKQHARYLQPESARINSTATYELLPNAHEIELACGNDETGWLYDTNPSH